jgi:hypothetical protein
MSKRKYATYITLNIPEHLISLYRVFQKELYNFESLYKFIQGTCTEFWTAIV